MHRNYCMDRRQIDVKLDHRCYWCGCCRNHHDDNLHGRGRILCHESHLCDDVICQGRVHQMILLFYKGSPHSFRYRRDGGDSFFKESKATNFAQASQEIAGLED